MPYQTSLNPDFLTAIRRLQTQPERILVTAHRDPDIDAIGSCLAMRAWLEQYGHTVTIWLEDKLPENARFLPQSSTIQTQLPHPPTLILTLDCANFQRIRGHEKLTQLLTENPNIPIINIDHHGDNPLYGTQNWLWEAGSSVGEMLTILFLEILDGSITADMATCLYAAIVFDTGRFLFSNTTQMTFTMTAKLLSAGADFKTINASMFESNTLADLVMTRQALENLVIHPSKAYAYTVLPATAASAQIKGIDVIRCLGGISMFAAFTQSETDEVKISLRSKGEVNVQEIAASFGGGGHKQAAGITLNGPIQEVVKQVLRKLDERFSLS